MELESISSSSEYSRSAKPVNDPSSKYILNTRQTSTSQNLIAYFSRENDLVRKKLINEFSSSNLFEDQLICFNKLIDLVKKDPKIPENWHAVIEKMRFFTEGNAKIYKYKNQLKKIFSLCDLAYENNSKDYFACLIKYLDKFKKNFYSSEIFDQLSRLSERAIQESKYELVFFIKTVQYVILKNSHTPLYAFTQRREICTDLVQYYSSLIIEQENKNADFIIEMTGNDFYQGCLKAIQITDQNHISSIDLFRNKRSRTLRGLFFPIIGPLLSPNLISNSVPGMCISAFLYSLFATAILPIYIPVSATGFLLYAVGKKTAGNIHSYENNIQQSKNKGDLKINELISKAIESAKSKAGSLNVTSEIAGAIKFLSNHNEVLKKDLHVDEINELNNYIKDIYCDALVREINAGGNIWELIQEARNLNKLMDNCFDFGNFILREELNIEFFPAIITAAFPEKKLRLFTPIQAIEFLLKNSSEIFGPHSGIFGPNGADQVKNKLLNLIDKQMQTSQVDFSRLFRKEVMQLLFKKYREIETNGALAQPALTRILIKQNLHPKLADRLGIILIKYFEKLQQAKSSDKRNLKKDFIEFLSIQLQFQKDQFYRSENTNPLYNLADMLDEYKALDFANLAEQVHALWDFVPRPLLAHVPTVTRQIQPPPDIVSLQDTNLNLEYDIR